MHFVWVGSRRRSYAPSVARLSLKVPSMALLRLVGLMHLQQPVEKGSMSYIYVRTHHLPNATLVVACVIPTLRRSAG